ncbi:MAG: hypothetical protein WCP87_06790 [Atribacterota bacterium]
MNQVKYSGFIEIFTLVLISFFSLTFFYFFQESMLHKRVGNAYLQKMKESYRLEGVLIEAKSLRESDDQFTPKKNITSNFCTEYTINIENDTICVYNRKDMLLMSWYVFRDGKVFITGIESRSYLPSMR